MRKLIVGSLGLLLASGASVAADAPLTVAEAQQRLAERTATKGATTRPTSAPVDRSAVLEKQVAALLKQIESLKAENAGLRRQLVAKADKADAPKAASVKGKPIEEAFSVGETLVDVKAYCASNNLSIHTIQDSTAGTIYGVDYRYGNGDLVILEVDKDGKVVAVTNRKPRPIVTHTIR